MDKDNRLCNKCGLLPQDGTKPIPPCTCKKKKKCKKDCCNDGFAFRKVVIPAALGDDKTGKDRPANGAYTNSYVVYEANGAEYMYDSYGVYTPIASSDEEQGVRDFNELENRPKYAGTEMTGDTDIPDVDAAVASEATLREEADANLADGISDEAMARQNTDNGLQSQIDAIAASSDVTDIVGTHAQLEAYDTSKLKDNDIIKVLQDETQNDETTYYRWSTSTDTFTLIGEEGPYYTKSAADIKFQDKLTAGANVSINQSTNTISATDTTYSDFTGTDGTDAGTSGLVPAPTVSDAGKYLKADGTWDTVSGGIPTNATFWGQSYDSTNNIVRGAVRSSSSLTLPTMPTNVRDGFYLYTSTTNPTVLGIASTTSSTGTDRGRIQFYGQSGFRGWSFYVGASEIFSVREDLISAINKQLVYLSDPTYSHSAATKNYVDSIYPIGAVFVSTSTTSPTIAGGTWTEIGTQTIGSSTVHYYERTA